MRLLSANVVVGFVAGPLLLAALVSAVSYLYDNSPVALRRIFLMVELLLVQFGSHWAFISTLFCAIIWLPIWLTQSFHFVFRKWTFAAFTGMTLGLVAFGLIYGGLYYQSLSEIPGIAFAGAISGMGIFLLSYLFRERPDMLPAYPRDNHETITD